MEKSSAYKTGENEAYHDYMEGNYYRRKLPYYLNNSEEPEFWKGYRAMWNKMDAADRGYNPHDGDTTADWVQHHS